MKVDIHFLSLIFPVLFLTAASEINEAAKNQPPWPWPDPRGSLYGSPRECFRQVRCAEAGVKGPLFSGAAQVHSPASCNLPLQVLILLAQQLQEPAAPLYDLILNYKEKHFEVTSNLTAFAYMKSQSIIII